MGIFWEVRIVKLLKIQTGFCWLNGKCHRFQAHLVECEKEKGNKLQAWLLFLHLRVYMYVYLVIGQEGLIKSHSLTLMECMQQ